METINFTNHEHDWWAWFMLHNEAAVDNIIKGEGFNPETLQVNIEVNGVTVMAKDFNDMMDELVKLALAEEMQKRGLHSIVEAASVEAKKIVSNIHPTFEQQMSDFAENLRQISECASSLIQSHYDAPFVNQTAEGLRSLYASARIQDAKDEEGNPVVQAFIRTDYLGQYGNATMQCIGEAGTEGEARLALEKVVTALIGMRKF